MTRSLIFTVVCACSLVSRGADDDVQFKPKAYTSGQSLRDRSYNESVYTASDTSQPIGKRIDPPRTSNRWHLFGREKTVDDKKLADVPAEHGTAYTQQKLISVPTIKADPRDIPEKKPFKESDQKLTDSGYMIKEGPREKDPMLTPRQSIKAPE